MDRVSYCAFAPLPLPFSERVLNSQGGSMLNTRAPPAGRMALNASISWSRKLSMSLSLRFLRHVRLGKRRVEQIEAQVPALFWCEFHAVRVAAVTKRKHRSAVVAVFNAE